MTQAKQIELASTGLGFDDYIHEEVSILTRLNEQRTQTLIEYSKSFLDKVFPLESGSHKDVSNYVVYYTHLLAFFADGSKSGLKYPKQFVALSGHKSEPTSILLEEAGFHVELIFDRNGARGLKDLAGIDDVQVETTKVLFSKEVASNDEKAPSRHWFSMIRDEQELAGSKGHSSMSRCLDVAKAFTSKDGQDYPLA